HGIFDTVGRVKKSLDRIHLNAEIIIIDDGSTDNTLEVLKKVGGIILISHPQNRGYGASLKTGLKKAAGEWIFITDADGTYPIEKLIEFWEWKDRYDMIVGARDPMSQNISLFRKPGKMVLSTLAQYLVGQRIPDLNSGMRLFRKELGMEFYHLYPQGFSFTITITLGSMVNNYSVKFIPIEYAARKGKSKMNVVKDGLNFIGLILRVVTYFKPSKTLLPLGLGLIILGVSIGVYSYFYLEQFMDATVTLLILGGIQMFIFSILAQLIVKNRGYHV
ncbi:MAG: glycosyltransferase family 2 protein, partial [archaeon]|nr:glycosyltransferase family 2 protein [archaeon]